MAEVINEPTNKIIANMVNVLISAAPLIAFVLFQKNQSSTAACNRDKYTAAVAMRPCQK
jgi:hypothetical protein